MTNEERIAELEKLIEQLRTEVIRLQREKLTPTQVRGEGSI